MNHSIDLFSEDPALTPIGCREESPTPFVNGTENSNSPIREISSGFVITELYSSQGLPRKDQLNTNEKILLNPKNGIRTDRGSSLVKQSKIVTVSTIEKSKKLSDLSDDHVIIITSKQPIKLTLPDPPNNKKNSPLTIKALYDDVSHVILAPNGSRIKNNTSFNLPRGSCKKFLYINDRYQVF